MLYRMANKKKRPVGRPKHQPKHAQVLQAEAQQKIREAQERRGQINIEDAEDTVALMMDSKAVARLESKDVKELRRQAEVLWELLEAEKYERELHEVPYKLVQTDDEFLDAPAAQGQMSRKEWLEAHEHLKPKRKNAKQTKNIETIKDKDFEKYGLTKVKIDETTDLDALEREAEVRMMEEEIAKRKEQRTLQPRVGKRLRPPEPSRPKYQPKNFWI